MILNYDLPKLESELLSFQLDSKHAYLYKFNDKAYRKDPKFKL